MTQFKDLNDVQQYFSNNGRGKDEFNSTGFKNFNDIYNQKNSNFNINNILKSKNTHLIKAVFNLMEELDISQLHYIKRYIDKRLNNNE